jgi:hypothetical protein
VDTFTKIISEAMNPLFALMLIGAFFILLELVRNAPEWIDRLLQPKQKKLEELKNALGQDFSLSESSKEVIGDLVEAELFNRAVGIYAERELREALINLHKDTSPKIDWKMIKRSRGFIKLENGEAVIHLTHMDRFIDKAMVVMVRIMIIGIGVFGLTTILLNLLYKFYGMNRIREEILKDLAVLVLLTVETILAMLLTAPLRSAVIISEALENLKKDQLAHITDSASVPTTP